MGRKAKAAAAAPANISPNFAADFNNDGILDVFAVDYVPNAYVGEVYLGRGDGTFHLPAGSEPIPVSNFETFGDLNNDGILDLAISNPNQTITTYLGKGDGTFQSGTTLPYSDIYDATLGDFNNDGKLDMIAFSQNGAVLLLGNGDGTFQPPTPTSPNGASIAVDLNGDGNLDLVAFYESSTIPSGVSVALGNGDGTFRTPQIYPALGTGYYSVGPYVADFNGDGIPDIACGYGGFVTFLLGEGNGNFYTSYNADSILILENLTIE